MLCAKCGQGNDNDAKFCVGCGAPVAASHVNSSGTSASRDSSGSNVHESIKSDFLEAKLGRKPTKVEGLFLAPVEFVLRIFQAHPIWAWGTIILIIVLLLTDTMAALGLLLLVVPTVGYLACWWWFIRSHNGEPEMSNSGGILLLAGILIPVIGIPMGLWYLGFGPTRSRSENRISAFLKEASPDDFRSWIDNQITSKHLWDQEWLKSTWTSLTAQQKEEIIAQNIEKHRANVRRFLRSYDHSTQGIEADHVAALRATLVDNSLPM